jgi:hypothetical protein
MVDLVIWTPFDWNDLFEDLLFGGLGTAFSYALVYYIVANSNSNLDSPYVLVFGIVAFIFLNSKFVRNLFTTEGSFSAI